MNRSVVIADPSCLIALDNIGEIDLLAKLFNKVFITPEVSSEFGKPLPEWLELKRNSAASSQNARLSILDPGEASSIALALDSTNPLLIIDERKGRRVAEEFGIEIIGTVGIMLTAHAAGFIELSETIVNTALNLRIFESRRFLDQNC